MISPLNDSQNTFIGLMSSGFEIILWNQHGMVIVIVYRAETETRRLENMQRRAKLQT